MDLITWDQSLSVNVKEIDEQHKELVNIINELHTAMYEERGDEILGKILTEMADYAAFHFKTEEDYFDKFEYENTEEHKAKHKDFVEKVSDFKQQFDNGSLVVSIELLQFLIDWLEDHLKDCDKKYTKCFNDHGLF